MLLILTSLKIVNQQIVLIGFFALIFLIVGINATSLIYSLSFKKLIRKAVLIVLFGIIFTLISSIIALNMLTLNINNIIMILSIISIILILISLFNRKSNEDKTIKYGVKLKSNKKDTSIDKISKRSLYFVILLCIISLVGILIPPFNIIPLWKWLYLPFVLFIPGYYLINAIIPDKKDIMILERVSVAVFTSMLLTSIVGLIIYQFEKKLDMIDVTIILILISLIFIIIYTIRSRKIPVENKMNHKFINRILIIITIIAVIGIIGSGIYSTNQNLNQGNTTFTVNGIQKTSNNGYYNFTNGENLTTQLNITNNEYKNMNYTVRVEVHNDTTDKVLSEDKISLKDKESTIIPNSITMSSGQKDIRYILYKNDKPYIIRHLYVNVSSSDY